LVRPLSFNYSVVAFIKVVANAPNIAALKENKIIGTLIKGLNFERERLESLLYSYVIRLITATIFLKCNF
jgi:hypothetical protein